MPEGGELHPKPQKVERAFNPREKELRSDMAGIICVVDAPFTKDMALNFFGRDKFNKLNESEKGLVIRVLEDPLLNKKEDDRGTTIYQLNNVNFREFGKRYELPEDEIEGELKDREQRDREKKKY